MTADRHAAAAIAFAGDCNEFTCQFLRANPDGTDRRPLLTGPAAALTRGKQGVETSLNLCRPVRFCPGSVVPRCFSAAQRAWAQDGRDRNWFARGSIGYFSGRMTFK